MCKHPDQDTGSPLALGCDCKPVSAGSILVHGGGSGIGTSAMALAKEAGVRCLVTAGSDEKCEQCRKFGAYAAINYKTQNFPDEVHKVEEVCDCCRIVLRLS